jgi:uncharacterized protein YjbJ (UPF0337 family)
MGQSTEELRREIADTRSELGTTVDAISDRVNPSRVVERRKQKLTAGLSAARESIMGSAADVQASVKAVGEAGHQLPDAAAKKTQGAPLVAGAMAFGLGFLAAAIFPGTDTEAQLAGKAQEIAQPAVEELKQSGQEAMGALREPLRDSAQHLKEEAESSVEEVRGTAQNAVEQTKDAASQAGEEVSNQAKESAESIRDR